MFPCINPAAQITLDIPVKTFLEWTKGGSWTAHELLPIEPLIDVILSLSKLL